MLTTSFPPSIVLYASMSSNMPSTASAASACGVPASPVSWETRALSPLKSTQKVQDYPFTMPSSDISDSIFAPSRADFTAVSVVQ